MSEKVLGFKEKDAIACIWRNMNTNNKFVIMKTEGNTIDKNDERKVNLVPVRLASESVDLKWLENYCKMNGYPFHDEDVVSVQDLLEAVRLQAEKEAKKK